MAITNKNILVSIQIIFFIMLFFVGRTQLANGHGAGLTLQKEVGDYSIDVDADVIILQAGEQIRFNFNIFTKDKISSPEFTDAWVRIAPKDGFGIIFASDLHKPDFGATGMTHTFPKGGEYDISVRFQKNGEEIAEEVSFPLIVENGPNASSKSLFSMEFFTGLFFGIFFTGMTVFFSEEKIRL